MFYEPSPQEMYDGGFPLPQHKPSYDGKFQSTVDKDLRHNEKGIMQIVPKEYPCWYGIKDIGFIWRGCWADPEIEYKGKQFSCYYVEDSMWSFFREEYPDASDEEFENYMVENVDQVYELADMIVENWEE